MKIAAAALLLALAGPLAVPAPAAASSMMQEADDPFAGAWSHEALEAEGEPLIKAWRAGGSAAGQAALERRLAGADAAERTRVLTAYGIWLMVEVSFELDPSAGAAAALPHFQRAVAEGRQAFAPDSRMLAILLADAASTEFAALGPATSPTAEAWLEEAHRIRVARLGPGHPETLSTLVHLAEIRGQAERVGGDPERIQAVSRLYEPLLAAEDAEGDDLTRSFVSWMAFLVGADQPDEACAVLDKMNGLASRLSLNMTYAGYALGESLSEAGYQAHAEPLVRDDLMALLGGGEPPAKPPRCGP